MDAPAPAAATPAADAAPAPAADAAAPSAPPDNAGAAPANKGGDAAKQSGDPDAKPGGESGADGEAAPDPAAESGATAQPGLATKRNGYVRRAREIYGGDRVAGDKIIINLTGSETTVTLQPMSPTEVDFAQYAFVPPAEWETLRLEFRDTRTALLRGTRGHGRTTMAIRLLQTVRATGIYLLRPQVDLTRLADRITGQRIPPGSAFLLTDPDDLASLHEHAFLSLEAALQDADARLVVTVETDAALPKGDLLRYQVTLPAAPERRHVLLRHLEYRLDETRAAEILGSADIRALVAEQLTETATCETAATLALHLSRCQDEDGRIDVDRVRARVLQSRVDEFDGWFENLRDVELRSFAIALAVLHGLSYDEMSAAAHDLRDLLVKGDTVIHSGNADIQQVHRRDVFRFGRAQLLKRLQARIVEEVPGSVPTMAVEFIDRTYAQRVLERAWHGYQIQNDLISWLDGLVATGSDTVRVFASQALGHLAVLSFDYLCRHVFNTWAGHDNFRYREAVAAALGVAARQETLRPHVTALVAGWYGNREKPLLQSTAALAHGTGLGAADPTVAFDMLYRLAMVDDLWVRLMIARGVTWLLAEEDDYQEQLMPRLYAMIERCANDERRAEAGQWMFVFVASDLQNDVPDGESVSAWPTLLRLAGSSGELRRRLVQMLVWVLTAGGPRSEFAHRVLRSWAAMAESNPSLRDALTKLARSVLKHDARAGRIIQRLAWQWNSEDELVPLPQIASAIGALTAPVYPGRAVA
ncbi:hypothetical protein GCM10009827_021790 [Dactylosporangium maewongense]|uniref:Uncharacterized protein n=1 Tax=Dactylosporangium maewongense TaxID=634393 RepID=A0ABN1ZY60_9ACTN